MTVRELQIEFDMFQGDEEVIIAGSIPVCQVISAAEVPW